MSGQVAVILGGTGMVGANMAQLLDRTGGWDTTIVSRRAPDFPTRARHLACDMSDPDECARVLGTLERTTHVFWTGHATGTRWVDKAARDADLFRNALTALEPAAPRLEHVCLLQGSKYYGRHLGPFKTPAKEDDPRHFPPNFYYTQEDFLRELAQGKRWSWSLMRPHIVCGFARTDINLPKPIAVYATLCKRLGLPLKFPGPEGAYRAVHCASDVELLNKGMLWAATTPAAANQAFNMVNGDHFRWEHLWPKIAAWFDMEPGGVQQIDLELMMADKAPLWDEIVREHGLLPTPFAEAANWSFANYAFAPTWDIMLDNTKARTFGFQEFVDSEKMFMRIFDSFRAQRFIP
ncbi:MAG TPA: SDR family oxidoreductase [Burkholderiaceae bacterium]|nr:SDR family oxidoreductase [Burkholderiaceae bacterium]